MLKINTKKRTILLQLSDSFNRRSFVAMKSMKDLKLIICFISDHQSSCFKISVHYRKDPAISGHLIRIDDSP